MPRISLVGDGHGGDEHYATFNLWWAAEKDIDYGSKIEAAGLGSVGGFTPNTLSVHGAEVYTLGVEFDGKNEDDLAYMTGHLQFDINASSQAAPITIRDLLLRQTNVWNICLYLHADYTTVTRVKVINPGSNTHSIRVDNSLPNSSISHSVIEGGLNGIFFGYNSGCPLNNITQYGATGSGLVATSNPYGITDSLFTENGGADINTAGVTSTSATGDGTEGTINPYTTAELVDTSAKDYRTKVASTLATAGSGGSFIGAFLESAGAGISDTLACNAFLSSSQFQVSDLFTSSIIESSSYQSTTLFDDAQLLHYSGVNDSITADSYLTTTSFSDAIFSDVEALDDTLTANAFTAATSFNNAALIDSIAGDYLLSADSFVTSAVFNNSLLLTDSINDANSSNTSTLFNDADLLKSSTDVTIADSFTISTTFNIASLSANSNYSHESSDSTVLFNNIDFRWSGDSAQVIGSVTAGFVSDTITVGYVPQSTTANFK